MNRVKIRFEVLIVILFILFLSIFVTINVSPICYWFAIHYLNLSKASNLSSASLMKCYFFMLKYLQVPWSGHLNLVYFRYSSKGLVHFRDVRHLVMFNNLCLIISGLFGMRIRKRWCLTDSCWRLINPLRYVLTGGLVLIGMALMDFQVFFIKFHQIMFRNRDWVFNTRTDPIITVLPTSFFAWCFVILVLMFIGLSSVMIHYSK